MSLGRVKCSTFLAMSSTATTGRAGDGVAVWLCSCGKTSTANFTWIYNRWDTVAVVECLVVWLTLSSALYKTCVHSSRHLPTQTGCESANSEGCSFWQNLHKYAQFYDVPAVLLNIGRSDHRAVVMSLSVNAKREHAKLSQWSDTVRTPVARCCYPRPCRTSTGRRCTTCKTARRCWRVSTALLRLVNYYIQLLTVKRHTTDKPWVIDQLWHLIWCRRYALRAANMARYKQLRNQVQRLTR